MTQNIAGAQIPGIAEGRGGRVLFAEQNVQTPGEGGALLWSPAGRGDCRTFLEAYLAVKASKAPLRIYVDQQAGDPPLTVPAGVYEMHGSMFTAPRLGDPSLNTIVCEPKTLWKNVAITGSVILQGNNARLFLSDDGPFLENTPTSGGSPPVYYANDGAQYQNNGQGGMIDVPLAGLVIISLQNSANFLNGVLTGSMVKLHAGQSALVIFEGVAVPPIGSNVVASDNVATTLGLWHDGNVGTPIAPAMFPLFTGTLVNTPNGQAGGSGPTASRPAGVFTPVPSGCMFYDTDITKPVWWDLATVAWVDATGAPA